MPSDFDDKLSDQFYRPSKQGCERQTEEPAISSREPLDTLRICQSHARESASVVIKKKYFEKLQFFRSQKTCLHPPQKHHKPTTKTPQKTITKIPIFLKTPCKNAVPRSANIFPEIEEPVRITTLPRRPGSLHPAVIQP